MDNLMETITGNPYYLIAAIVILLFLAFSLVKKLFKLALVLLVVFVGYVLYLNFTGQDVNRTLKKQMKVVEEKAADVKDKAGEILDNDAVKETVDKAAKTLKKK